MGAISHYIKEIGRGARGAKALTRVQAADLFTQVLDLDGSVSDLEIGAFCVAMRIKGESAEEMSGFLDATLQHIAPFSATAGPLIVLPSYNGARKLPNLTPLLALLLAREGLAVLVHGMPTEPQRVLTSEILAALGIEAFSAQPYVSRAIAPGEVAHVDMALLHPGLARLLAVRGVIGLRTPAHSVVKLLAPTTGAALLLSSYTHPEYSALMQEVFVIRGMNALLSRGLEGEVAADPRRQPRYDGFVHGTHQLLAEQQPGTLAQVLGLPSQIDVATTVEYTRAVLAAALPIPCALAQQVAHVLTLVRGMQQVRVQNQEQKQPQPPQDESQ